MSYALLGSQGNTTTLAHSIGSAEHEKLYFHGPIFQNKQKRASGFVRSYPLDSLSAFESHRRRATRMNLNTIFPITQKSVVVINKRCNFTMQFQPTLYNINTSKSIVPPRVAFVSSSGVPQSGSFTYMAKKKTAKTPQKRLQYKFVPAKRGW